MNDNELAFLAGKNNETAFNELYYRHHGRVYGQCLRILKNTHEAEDLTQEVFMKLFRKIRSFKGDAPFTTWFHSLTLNEVRMHLRKPLVKHEHTSAEGEVPEQIVLGTQSPRKMAIVDKISIGSAIAQLPDGYKQVLTLHDIQGYTHDEVASILKCSPGTSKSQLHRARLKMRQLLKKRSMPRPVSVV